MSAPKPIPPEAIDRAKAAFAADHSLTDDLVPGTFFDNPAYFDSLPREAKAPVCAVQWEGAHPDRPGLCHVISEQFFTKYELSKNEDELTAAFACEALSLRYVLPQHPGRGKSNHHMGLLWQRKWEKFKAPEDLDNALRHYRLAVDHAVAETDVTKSGWVNDVAFMLCHRKAPGDLDEAERSFDRAIELAGPGMYRIMYLSNKGYTLVNLYKDDVTRDVQRLSRAIPCLAESVKLLEAHLVLPERQKLDYARIFNNAGTGFYTSWDVTGDPSHLDQAIKCNGLAAKYAPRQDSWDYLRYQAQYLLDRHEIADMMDDLVEATEVADEATTAAAANPAALGECLWIVGKARRRWYEQDRNKQTLQNAIVSYEEALLILPDGSTILPSVRNDLGNAYVSMFSQENKPEDLDKGIQAYEQALHALHEADPDHSQGDILMINSDLGQAMLHRFLFWKSESDLDSCIKYYRRSLGEIHSTSRQRRYAVDPSHRRFAIRAGNLAQALQQSFVLNQDDNKNSLLESESLILTALNGPAPLSGNLKNWLKTHLANAYFYEHQMLPSVPKLKLAIERYDEALAEHDAPTAYRLTTVANRCAALADIAELTQAAADFDVAITAYAELPADIIQSDLMFAITSSLARLHYHIWLNSKGMEPRSHGRQALELYIKVLSDNSAPLGSRINAGSVSAKLAAELDQDYLVARDLIYQCLDLLPQAILLHESRLTQLQFVRKFSFLPSSVTSLSLQAGDEPSTAISRLESGRAIIWDRLIGMRSAVDRLQDVDPRLAEQFAALQKMLSGVAPVADKGGLTDVATLLPGDEARLQRQRAAEEYRVLLNQIRSRPGLDDFLQVPKTSKNLQGYAKDAPIVFVNASAYRSDALIITKDRVLSLALEQFDMENITKAAATFLETLDDLSKQDPTVVLNACSRYKALMWWLWTSAAKPILEAIDLTSYSRGHNNKPRLIWVSTGWVSVLPLHAAGDFTTSTRAEGRSCVHDFVVSSYITSLQTLTYARQNELQLSLAGREPKSSPEAVILTMAKTPGNADLNVAPEADSFEKELQPHFITHVRPQPDSKQVKQELQARTIAHFACHAQADMKDPSKSALLFTDCVHTQGSKEGELRDPQPFSVRTLLNLRLDACQLVYLSGCETGANRDLALRDEGIHLASGFHMAGVPHVISTLWRVDDEVAASLAGCFYKHLKGDGVANMFERVPDALHLAVQDMRDKGVEPILWGAFVHSGP